MDEQEKRRAIDVALVQMEKQFGKGSILRLGSRTVEAEPKRIGVRDTESEATTAPVLLKFVEGVVSPARVRMVANRSATWTNSELSLLAAMPGPRMAMATRAPLS